MRQYARGLSLIEVMVSMVIGLFLVLGATTVYVNSRKTADVDDAIARLQETARYALSIIETDVRMANYWGMKKDGSSFDNKASQLNASIDSNALVADTGAEDCGDTYAIDVETYITGSNNKYELECAANGSAATTADTLTIRRAATTTASLDGSQLQICSNRDKAQIILGNTCTDEIHNLIVNAYFVAQGSDQSSTYPSLRRKTLVSGPDFQEVEIIPGVEDMQVQLGWDSTGTSAGAVQYVQPGNGVLATGQIVAVRVWLLIRAETPDQSYTDTRYYEYGDRAATNGDTSTLNTAGAAAKRYYPHDHYRRLLVERTFFVRNAVGT